MIGSKIKAARHAKGYSLEYMATLLDLTQASYSRIETNQVSPDIFKLKMISSALGLDMSALLDDMHNAIQKGYAGC